MVVIVPAAAAEEKDASCRVVLLAGEVVPAAPGSPRCSFTQNDVGTVHVPALHNSFRIP
jgi:hypothetical protein